jgi:uncharacterized protein (TIGR00288 family)
MENEHRNELRIALLIDADNISPKYIQKILEECLYKGKVTYRRLYGNIGDVAKHAGWKDVSLNFAITPMAQYHNTVHKNATDSAMIIDAMDILYSGSVDAFCIATSDGDFTGLAKRLKESNMTVFVAGEKNKTPRALTAACDQFFMLNEEKPEPKKPTKPIVSAKKSTKIVPPKEVVNEEPEKSDGITEIPSLDSIVQLTSSIIENTGTDKIPLSALVNKILQFHPQFQTNLYKDKKGVTYKKAKDFFVSLGFILTKDATNGLDVSLPATMQ